DAAAGETRHAFPFFLPDGRRFLYVAFSEKPGGAASTLYVGTVGSSDRVRVMPTESNVQYMGDHLLVLRDGTLLAQPFDLERLSLVGDPFPLGDQIAQGTAAGGAFTVSPTGLLAYQSGASGGRSRLVWFDRNGRQTGVLGEEANQQFVSLSPDGRRAAISIVDPARRTSDIWIYEVASGRRTRFTFDPATESLAAWSRDGARIVFDSDRKGRLDLYENVSSGTGSDQPLLQEGDFAKYPDSFSPDGRFLLFASSTTTPKTGADLWLLPLAGDRKPFPFLQTPFDEFLGLFSPDGRWVAYMSNESGRYETYVTTFPDRRGKWLISTNGGRYPRWRGDGREIFYLEADGRIIAAEVSAEGTDIRVGAVRPLFDTRLSGAWPYDVTPDGQRFLLNMQVEEAASQSITLVINATASRIQ
ncbi:MAG: hypothetical protein ACRDFA_04305, partial [bacterium]